MAQRLLGILFLAAASCELSAQVTAERSADDFALAGRETTYTVSPGEGLYLIARKFDLSYTAIAAANGLADPNRIYAGQKLVLPLRTILPRRPGKEIVINLPEFRLFYFDGPGQVSIYPACIGLPTWTTPVGEFRVTHRIKNPTWYMPESISEREKVLREIVPPGPENPLGDFWIGTDLDHTGIHGTNQPMSVGLALSHGCVRLYPEDVESLFSQVGPDMDGAIIYDPVKMAVSRDSVFLEVHPDVYGFAVDYAKELEQKLKLWNPLPALDREILERVLREKKGIPVFVGIRDSSATH
jgi:L,D-transpeptidase ErfK/SrfK